MLYLKKNFKRLYPLLLLCLSLASCQIFDDAKHMLNYFCPKLHIGINGVREHTSRDRAFATKSYIVNFPDKYENQVENYFQQSNGYSVINGSDISGVNTDEEVYVDQNDNVVGKRFKSGIDSAIVAFNRTKQEIIIIEYLNNPRAKH